MRLGDRVCDGGDGGLVLIYIVCVVGMIGLLFKLDAKLVVLLPNLVAILEAVDTKAIRDDCNFVVFRLGGDEEIRVVGVEFLSLERKDSLGVHTSTPLNPFHTAVPLEVQD